MSQQTKLGKSCVQTDCEFALNETSTKLNIVRGLSVNLSSTEQQHIGNEDWMANTPQCISEVSRIVFPTYTIKSLQKLRATSYENNTRCEVTFFKLNKKSACCKLKNSHLWVQK